MADAEKDIIGPGEDLLEFADGGGPFQCFNDVPGKGQKCETTLTPDQYKGNHQAGQAGKQGGLGGAVKDNLAGR